MGHAELFQRDRFAFEVGKRFDFWSYHQGVVTGGIVIDQNRFDCHTFSQRCHGIGPCLGIGIELASRQCRDRIGVIGEPNQLDVRTVFFEKAFLFSHIPRDPTRPVGQTDLDFSMRGSGTQTERNAKQGSGKAAQNARREVS